MIKYLLFDVAGTLLYKPMLLSRMEKVLSYFGHLIPLDELKFKHKLLSETFQFPDRTSSAFYKKFNTEFLYLLGVVPNQKLLNQLFDECSYLDWEKYEDTNLLNTIDLPMGIISNFNISLREKINFFFGSMFCDFFVSEETSLSKPNIEFYNLALNTLNYKPSEILYIGDSFKLDFEPANSLGIQTLLIDRDNFYTNNSFTINNLKQIKPFINNINSK